MPGISAVNPKLRLLNMLKQGQTVIATFMMFNGARTAKIVAHTGLDVSAISSCRDTS
jgi:4-hydroxy-2-oxoheptanedioate aldolase